MQDEEKKKPSFFKRVFTIPNMMLPRIRIRIPNWRTPEVNMNLPSIAGWSPPKIHIASFRGLRVVGGVWRVGTIGIGVGLIVTTIAILSAVSGLSAAPTWPSPALYNASLVQPDHSVQVGQDWDQFFTDQTPAEVRKLQTMTLQLNMSGARAGDITIDGLNIGKASGLTDAIQIIGATGYWLECDEIIISNVVATGLSLENSEIYELVLTNNIADGLSVSPTLDNAVLDIVVQSTRGSVGIPAISNGDYDRIILSTIAASSQCRTLTLSNIKAFGAGLNLDNIKAGKLTIQSSVIGSGSGINSADFVITATTKIQSLTSTGNVERPVKIQ
jgi:hypothetical protein|tara:strand:- start:24 stop:1013 length:990 start_codon:yes stop_codon:yes gene_type:complete